MGLHFLSVFISYSFLISLELYEPDLCTSLTPVELPEPLLPCKLYTLPPYDSINVLEPHICPQVSVELKFFSSLLEKVLYNQDIKPNLLCTHFCKLIPSLILSSSYVIIMGTLARDK